MENNKRLVVNVKEASELLGLSRASTYQGISTGEIPSIKVGKRILIPLIRLEKIMDEAGNNSMSK
jgi:excisionase family DNA binding protein